MRARWLATLLLVLFTVGCTIQPIHPETQVAGSSTEEAAALAVVQQFSDYSSEPMTMQRAPDLAAMYAEDAVKRDYGVDASTIEKVGRKAIEMQVSMDDATLDLTFRAEPLFALGDTVVARGVSDSEINQQFGLEPLEELVVYVIKDGLIQSDISVLTPDTIQRLYTAAAEDCCPEYLPDPALDKRIGVVSAAVAPWAGESVTPAAVEESLKWFADDVKVTYLGLPTGTEVYAGKEQLRAQMEQWVALHARWEWEPLMRSNREIGGRSKTWMDPTMELGVAPIEATDVFVVKDGLITEEVWAIDPASLERLLAAIGGADAQ